MLVVAIAGSVWPSNWHRPIHFFSDTVQHLRAWTLCVHPSRAYVAPVAYSSTCEVAGTYGTGVLCSRAWVRMDVARHM